VAGPEEDDRVRPVHPLDGRIGPGCQRGRAAAPAAVPPEGARPERPPFPPEPFPPRLGPPPKAGGETGGGDDRGAGPGAVAGGRAGRPPADRPAGHRPDTAGPPERDGLGAGLGEGAAVPGATLPRAVDGRGGASPLRGAAPVWAADRAQPDD
jgi:hypothetical protein